MERFGGHSEANVLLAFCTGVSYSDWRAKLKQRGSNGARPGKFQGRSSFNLVTRVKHRHRRRCHCPDDIPTYPPGWPAFRQYRDAQILLRLPDRPASTLSLKPGVSSCVALQKAESSWQSRSTKTISEMFEELDNQLLPPREASRMFTTNRDSRTTVILISTCSIRPTHVSNNFNYTRRNDSHVEKHRCF